MGGGGEGEAEGEVVDMQRVRGEPMGVKPEKAGG